MFRNSNRQKPRHSNRERHPPQGLLQSKTLSPRRRHPDIKKLNSRTRSRAHHIHSARGLKDYTLTSSLSARAHATNSPPAPPPRAPRLRPRAASSSAAAVTGRAPSQILSNTFLTPSCPDTNTTTTAREREREEKNNPPPSPPKRRLYCAYSARVRLALLDATAAPTAAAVASVVRRMGRRRRRRDYVLRSIAMTAGASIIGRCAGIAAVPLHAANAPLGRLSACVGVSARASAG